MYRIRAGSGAEAVYNSLEEFNAAVRRGAVSPDDEIFHMRANRWLDVKSHPHYRLAIAGFSHSETPAVSAAAAVHPTPPNTPPTPAKPMAAPGPVQSTRSQASGPAPSSAPAPVQAARPQQTVLRPQFIAQQPASTGAAAKRNTDLPSISSGGPAPASQRNATVIEARRPPAPPSSAASSPPKTESKAAPSTSEVEFLVMDGGIESPVRTSAGHRTIPPEDLDLLFDTPVQPAKPLTGSAAVVAATLPKTLVQAPPRMPAPRVERPAIQSAIIEPPKSEKPKAEVPKAKAPRPVAVVAPPAPKVVPPVSPVSAVPVPAAQVEPRQPPAAAQPKMDEDLSIPGAALLDAPVAAPHPAPIESHAASEAAGRSMGVLIAASVALLVTVGGLLAWKPWNGHASSPPTVQAQAPSEAMSPQGTAPLNSGATPAPTAPAGTTPPKPGSPDAPTPKSTGVVARVDTAATRQPDEEVIAAARPNFRADVDVPSGDLGLGPDIHPTTAASPVIAPSELTSRLEAAEKLAQLELGTKLGGFRSLLTPNRLATADGVASARAAWASSAEIIRQYRARIARMEKAYEDSVLTSQRAQRWASEEMRAWAGHQSLAEPVETSQLTDLMVSQVSEGLDILAALDGQYVMKGGLIVFKNPASGIRYTSIRTWVEQRMQAWSSTPESARANSVSAILRALGDGFPATE